MEILILVCTLLVSPAKEGSIALPEEVLAVSQITSLNDHLFIWDVASETIWKIDRNGKLIKSYRARGNGPGEFVRISRIRSYQGVLYLCDWAKRSLIRLDEHFNYLSEWKTEGLCRDVVVQGPHVYIVSWNPKNRNMIQQYKKADMAFVRSFGTALEDERLMGSQAGYAFWHDGGLWFVHNGFPGIERFSETGKSDPPILLPGFKDEPLISFGMFTGEQTQQFTLDGCFLQNGTIYVRIRDYQEKKRWIYGYHVKNQSFSKYPCPMKIVWDHNSGIYEVVKNEDDEPIGLKPFRIE